MKWGVRRAQRKQARAEAKTKKQNEKLQREFSNKVKKNWMNSYSKAAGNFNRDIKTINDKYKDEKFDDNFSTKRGQQYVKEVDSMWRKHYSDALLKDIGPEPISKGTDWVNNAPMMNSYSEFIIKD